LSQAARKRTGSRLEASWNADEHVVIFSAVAFIALWEWRAARRPAVKHYDADEIEIIPPTGPR
jgi:hypothetical protein